jgi:hypothetical protein
MIASANVRTKFSKLPISWAISLYPNSRILGSGLLATLKKKRPLYLPSDKKEKKRSELTSVVGELRSEPTTGKAKLRGLKASATSGYSTMEVSTTSTQGK